MVITPGEYLSTVYEPDCEYADGCGDLSPAPTTESANRGSFELIK
jgi:hypothetical protein